MSAITAKDGNDSARGRLMGAVVDEPRRGQGAALMQTDSSATANRDNEIEQGHREAAGGGPTWMPVGTAPPGCPPGLEYLATLSKIIVQQNTEVLEAITGFETENKYSVLNAAGQRMYTALEESGCCSRFFCGYTRAYTMHILDNSNSEVIRISRSFKCCGSCSCCACFPCWAQQSTVEAPPGNEIGYIRQTCHPCNLRFAIKDEHGATKLKVEGPCVTASCCCQDIKFGLFDTKGEKVGKIVKEFSGMGVEVFTDADNFAISFPEDLDVKIKATLLGALFLIDFMEFEDKETGTKKKDKKKRRH